MRARGSDGCAGCATGGCDGGMPDAMLQELSMGMSGDFEVAVQEGATIVRVGTAIFGTRTPSANFKVQT